MLRRRTRTYGGSSGERHIDAIRVLVAGGPELKRTFDLGYEILAATPEKSIVLSGLCSFIFCPFSLAPAGNVGGMSHGELN
jgi:hypothetical protein